jgi:CrcB protein
LIWIIVMVGGALGSVMRWSFGLWGWGRWTVLAVNFLGSLLLGWSVAIYPEVQDMSMAMPLYLGWAVGLCGGLTTFSSFALETLHLLRMGQWRNATLFLIVMLAGSYGGVWVGIELGSE